MAEIIYKGYSMAIAITPDNFEQTVMKATKPLVIDVYATWCGPCQQMKPIFNELESELGDTYIFATLNVDEARDISIKFGVTSVPTFIFMDKGVVKGKETGYMNKASLKEKITAALK
jgi:thioredoxin 1